ncbi:ADP-ribosylglycohydrolase family protein, partial [Streptomyces sp. WAC 01325]|uniref:ADP-ribosylglycohydrolase family protein n=1 Tax=Streptomyces sp. WAC 01325 TaxID=2203202 RepID=UPI0021AFF341
AAEAVLRAGDDTALGDLSRERRTRAAIDLTWNAVASEVAAAADRAPEIESAILPLRARISVRAGLGNLATGLRPPATGHDNPHYFDDAACIRACVLAVAHPGDPHRAAEAVLRAGDDTALGDLSRERRTRAAIDLTWNAVASEVAAAA